MKIYLDDNRAGAPLAQRLRREGHEVVRPKDVDLVGAADPVHMEYAVRFGLVMLSADSKDFELLHLLIKTSGGKHPGILLVRFDSNPQHDMKPKHIAEALRKLGESGVSWENDVIILNFWR